MKTYFPTYNEGTQVIPECMRKPPIPLVGTPVGTLVHDQLIDQVWRGNADVRAPLANKLAEGLKEGP